MMVGGYFLILWLLNGLGRAFIYGLLGKGVHSFAFSRVPSLRWLVQLGCSPACPDQLLRVGTRELCSCFLSFTFYLTVMIGYHASAAHHDSSRFAFSYILPQWKAD